MDTRFEDVVSADLYNACWHYCCRLSTDHNSAEDLLQEALVRAYLRLGQLKDTTRAKGWLFSIIRTSHIDRLRMLNSRPQTVSAESVVYPATGNPEIPVQLATALATLPDNQRELIELFHLDDLTLMETAQVLGIGVNTMKQRLLRARAALKRQLEPAWESGELEDLF